MRFRARDAIPPDHPELIDPDPVTIILGIVGAVGGVVRLVATVREVWWNAPPRVRSRLADAAGRLSDDLRHMEVDLSLLEGVVDATADGPLPFRLGSQLYLTREQFRRYREAAERLMLSAARSVKRIHDLEAALSPDVLGREVSQPLGVASDAIGQLNGLLSDDHVTVRDALLVLRAAIANARELLTFIEESLNG